MGEYEAKIHINVRGLAILAVAFVEDDANVKAQIAKQTYPVMDTLIMTDEAPAKGIEGRRKKIAYNQNLLKQYVKDSTEDYDLIWQLEGDVELEEDTLARLVSDFFITEHRDLAFVSGIQVGRHGLYHIGAWHITDDTHFESVDHNAKGIAQVDATGLYCLLSPYDKWISGRASWQGEPYGPDVLWSLSIEGNKFVDMELEIGHRHNGGIIYPHHQSTCTVYFDKTGNEWKYRTKL